MFFVIIGTLVLLALLDRTLRGGRIRLAELDFRFGLFEIRDVLRDAAINEEISYSKWFDYMDTTLTRTLDSVEAVNPWMAVGHSLVHRNDSVVIGGMKELQEALRRPENRKIARVYSMYNECLAKFLKARFPISWPLAALTFAYINRKNFNLFEEEEKEPKPIEVKTAPVFSTVTVTVQEEERKLAPVFSFSPETSTFAEYVINSKQPEVAHGPTLALQ